MKNKLKNLPKMDELLDHDSIKNWEGHFTRDFIKKRAEESIDEVRQAILAGDDSVSVELDAIARRVVLKLEDFSTPSLQRVVNATGTVLHTNLGRALLTDKSLEALSNSAKHYSNLEYNLNEGKRGTRYAHVEEVLRELTGAEAALVVNNNAAAVMLMLSALTEGKEILVSRGELVEIGGSFRIPDVIESVGSTIKEVGATNKTHLKDYKNALSENTGAVLRAHTSNYRVIGFSEAVDDKDLVDFAHENGLPAFNDLGSGLFLDLQHLGLPYEPTVKETIDAGFDVVSFSGDKLLGGPQAGIIVGKKKYIDVLKKHPLLRALRVDKFTIVALEQTFRTYLKPEEAFEEIPTLKIVGQSQDVLKNKAEYLTKAIKELDVPYEAQYIEGFSQVGGGSYPGVKLPTYLVQITHPKCSPTALEENLRTSKSHIITRISDGYIQFDVRTLDESDMALIITELSRMIID